MPDSQSADTGLVFGRIKICGLTNLEDARIAVRAGADYLGFIFYPRSKRSMVVEDAKPLVMALRAEPDCPLLVGVFVNESATTMKRILDDCQLDLAQLSGDETPNLLSDPASPIYGRGYKAIRPQSLLEAQSEVEWYMPSELFPEQPSILVDTYHQTKFGGTGQTADWTLASELVRDVPKLMLAGGLKPGNVAQAIRQVQPYAVDVASGVEKSPGKKDHDQVRAFVNKARLAWKSESTTNHD